MRLTIRALVLAMFAVVLPLSTHGTDTAEELTSKACVNCHEEMVADHDLSVHREVSCVTCHPEATKADHEQLGHVNCLQCHKVHHEGIIHDAHTRVTCVACHMSKGIPSLDTQSNRVVWSGTFRPGAAFRPHQLVRVDGGNGCRNCHFPQNSMGAAAMVLPPKSVLCMPCHVATLSLDDTVSRVSFLIFIVGMAGMSFVWLSGRMAGGTGRSRAAMSLAPSVRRRNGPVTEMKENLVERLDEKTSLEGLPRLVSDKTPGRGDRLSISHVLRALFSDLIFQRKLYILSPGRWAIHGLIFFPILIRFTFGLAALAFSLWLPNLSVTTAMLYKNHPVGALFFDLTGLMILAATLAATYRNAVSRDTEISSLPETGWGLSALLAAIVLMGFVLEGIRIAMTGWPEGTEYAFVGYGISFLFQGIEGLTDGYGYVWYVHALFVGIFAALIPFTRMSHALTAPLVGIANAWTAKND